MLARRVLAVALLFVGGLLVTVALWLAVFTIVSPECSVDRDDAVGVLLVRVFGVAWVVLELLLVAVVVVRYRRSSPHGWSRTGAAATLPAGAIGIWIAVGGLLALALMLVDAGAGSSACF